MRVLTVANQKGGVTKTTTSVNVAGYLAQDGYRVLLVDIDPQGNATLGTGIGVGDYEYTTLDLLTKFNIRPEKMAIEKWNNLFVIPSNITLCTYEVSACLGEFNIKLDTLLDRFKEVTDIYDYVIIDTPPSLGVFTLNAFYASDRFLVPIDGGNPFAMTGFVNLYNATRSVWGSLYKNGTERSYGLRPLGFFRTKWTNSNLSRMVWDTLSQNYSRLAMNTIVPVNVKVSEAMAEGVHASEYDANAKGTLAYRALTNEIKERWEGAVWL